MALKTQCQTPGAMIHSRVSAGRVSIAVDLPKSHQLDLDRRGADLLEANLHNAIELVLARYFEPPEAKTAWRKRLNDFRQRRQ